MKKINSDIRISLLVNKDVDAAITYIADFMSKNKSRPISRNEAIRRCIMLYFFRNIDKIKENKNG